MITKYSPDNQELLFFQATSTDDFLINAVSLAADANDNIYVLQKDGVIKIFNNDLKYQRMFNPGLTEASSLDIDSKGRLFVASRLHNKIVVVSPDGTVEAELGSPDSKSGPLAYPVRVVVSKNDDLVVCENLPTGIRIKVFSPQLELKKKFMIDKLKYIAWTMMGIDPNNRIYFNDHAGFDGIVIYDSSNGKFFGKSLRTKSRQTFDHPGGLTVNKWTGAIYVAYIPGVVQCRLPNPS